MLDDVSTRSSTVGVTLVGWISRWLHDSSMPAASLGVMLTVPAAAATPLVPAMVVDPPDPVAPLPPCPPTLLLGLPPALQARTTAKTHDDTAPTRSATLKLIVLTYNNFLHGRAVLQQIAAVLRGPPVKFCTSSGIGSRHGSEAYGADVVNGARCALRATKRRRAPAPGALRCFVCPPRSGGLSSPPHGGFDFEHVLVGGGRGSGAHVRQALVRRAEASGRHR